MIVLQETKVTSEMEGDRTNKEAETLTNIKIPSDDPNKPDIEIEPDGYPTLIGQFLALYFTRSAIDISSSCSESLALLLSDC